MDSIVLLREKGFEFITQGPENIEIDLSQVRIQGSSAIALLLSWIKFAVSLNKKLSFSHPGEKLLLIARATGVEDIMNFNEPLVESDVGSSQ